MKYIIGLTGNLGSGKSAVLGMLRELGAYGIDADGLVREVSAPETTVGEKIKEAFGLEIMGPGRTIDRQRLAAKVFSDPLALRKLEEIVHPAVEEKTWELVRNAREAVVAIEAIKLIEAGMHKKCKSLWVVVCNPQVAKKRLLATGKWNAEEIEARLRAQSPVEQKIALADVVIDNSGTREETLLQVEAAWSKIPEEYRRGG